jgi:hypothetical protein
MKIAEAKRNQLVEEATAASKILAAVLEKKSEAMATQAQWEGELEGLAIRRDFLREQVQGFETAVTAGVGEGLGSWRHEAELAKYQAALEDQTLKAMSAKLEAERWRKQCKELHGATHSDGAKHEGSMHHSSPTPDPYRTPQSLKSPVQFPGMFTPRNATNIDEFTIFSALDTFRQ